MEIGSTTSLEVHIRDYSTFYKHSKAVGEFNRGCVLPEPEDGKCGLKFKIDEMAVESDESIITKSTAMFA